jgi:hypothetical protein
MPPVEHVLPLLEAHVGVGEQVPVGEGARLVRARLRALLGVARLVVGALWGVRREEGRERD